MKGNEAIGEAAIRSGCLHFFAYPITPQSEIPEYLAKRLPEVGGVYLQAESEVAAVNMMFGAAGVGIRVFTSSSSPGISLMSEGLSYIATCSLPVVVVNMMRSGPGLGGILPAQSDYFQATKGGGHGDYQLVVLGPASVQEAVDLTFLAFRIAEEYLTPVMLLGDGMIGQMMEPVEFPEDHPASPLNPGDWALTGAKDRKKRLVNSLYLDPKECNRINLELKAKYDLIASREQRFELYNCDEPYDLLVCAFGMMSRICKTAIDELATEGRHVGLFRPITLNPFPYQACNQAIQSVNRVLVMEMNMGQMREDVQLAAEGLAPVDFAGTAGGLVMSPEEVKAKMLDALASSKKPRARAKTRKGTKA